MSWKDRLRPAKFRNASFQVECADGDLGRRIALHEYPGRDLPYAEDMGRKSREISMTAYVLGPDYMDARDALSEALETAGPGTLVHPYRGALTVALLSARGPQESTREGGMAWFSLVFVETDENRWPRVVTDTSATVKTKAEEAAEAAKTGFAKVFDVAKKASYLANAALNVAGSFLDSVEAIAAKPFAVVSNMYDFTGRVEALRNQAINLIYAPADLANAVYVLTDYVGDLITVPYGLKNYDSLFVFGDDFEDIPATTANRLAQAANEEALVSLIKQVAVITAVKAVSDMAFDNYTQAIETRDLLAERLDDVMAEASDTVYNALWDLRGAMIKDISARGATLARLIDYTPASTLPALVIAHRLYGDASRESEIIRRNNIRHPGFVPGGVALEVALDE
ncbi:DNA circulation-like protein [uncultured Desulfobacterium sp.]|uniref:DNA circulation-like protein n=1 Tax=uncultured Desulfobacterium sp. TaxID=201089 RepID=A0A445MWS4_9BACT|nr:DNA circulation-like protein [uncultured Desulfobacterium sp.]